MHEILTLQVGQCGNQIGNEFWNKIIEEHSANEGRKDRFFYNSDSDNLIPRAVLIDSEPRAIGSIATANNVFIGNEGTGAGNNWAHGHQIGIRSKEDVMDMISRHVEACDAMEGIYLIHSTAGGTGSGFGSFLAEELKDCFSKSILTSFSMLPNNSESSDVVVQPYNTVLTLNSIYKNMDSVVLMDNGALASQLIGSKVLSYDSLNSIAADVICSYSSPVRYPTYMYCDNRSILNCTVPIKNYKFVIPSYVKNRNYSVGEIMSSLCKTKNMLCKYEQSAVYNHFSVFNILGNISDRKSICRSSELLQSKLSFVDLPYYLSISNKNSFVNISLNNSTATKSVFQKICSQFDQLRKRSAFLDIYRKFDLCQEEFDLARENIGNVIEIYEEAEISKIKY